MSGVKLWLGLWEFEFGARPGGVMECKVGDSTGDISWDLKTE